MKYDVGDELISISGKRATVVGYVYWEAHHRYYVYWPHIDKTEDMTINIMDYHKLRKV